MIGLGLNVWLANGGQPWMPAGAAWGVNLAGPGATFARPSAGAYEAGGAVTSFPAGAPRTGSRGMLIEPAATNHLKHSSDYAQAVWVRENFGTIGKLPVVTPGVTAPDGTATAHTVALDAVGAAGISSLGQNLALSGALTLGVWMRTPDTGTKTVRLRLDSTSGAVAENVSVTGNWQKFTLSHSGGADLKAVTIARLRPQSGTDTSATLQVWGAQVEAGSAPSSHVPTGASSALRAADVLTIMAPQGNYTVTVTFDDSSTQVLTGQTVTASGWAVPTNLNRPYIKTITAEAA